MEMQDDRTPEQKLTHQWLIVGTDFFLSGWGKATGGKSYAAWACTEEMAPSVLEWVQKRGDMKRARIVYGDWKPKGTGHAHIYVVTPDHPACPHWLRK